MSNSTNKAELLRDLRLKIQAMEVGLSSRGGPPGRLSVNKRLCDKASVSGVSSKPKEASSTEHGRQSAGQWNLGVPKIDCLLPDARLQPGGIHEIKPMSDGDWLCNHVCAFGFLLRLLRRRLLALQGGEGHAPVLLCWPHRLGYELGDLYAPGLRALGFDLSSLIIATPQTVQDQLWVMEEGLNSGALAAVVALVDEIGLTPARRLSLSARAHGTPCLLLTHPHRPAIGPAFTRWRVGPAPSAPPDLDARAPGNIRFELRLERCRHGTRGAAAAIARAEQSHTVVEWSDEAHSFHLAARLADRAVDKPVHEGRRYRCSGGVHEPDRSRSRLRLSGDDGAWLDDYSGECARTP